jgi:hypothetical protein
LPCHTTPVRIHRLMPYAAHGFWQSAAGTFSWRVYSVRNHPCPRHVANACYHVVLCQQQSVMSWAQAAACPLLASLGVCIANSICHHIYPLQWYTVQHRPTSTSGRGWLCDVSGCWVGWFPVGPAVFAPSTTRCLHFPLFPPKLKRTICCMAWPQRSRHCSAADRQCVLDDRPTSSAAR